MFSFFKRFLKPFISPQIEQCSEMVKNNHAGWKTLNILFTQAFLNK